MKTIALILILTPLFSCSSEVLDSSIKGKWAGVKDGEYYEMHIDSNKIFVFSHWMGNRGSFQYVKTEDSIFYIDLDFGFAYRRLNDSILLFLSDVTDTLYQLINTLTVFDEIDQRDSSEFISFYNSFYIRAMQFYRLQGYDIKEMSTDSIVEEKFIIDLDPKEEEILE